MARVVTCAICQTPNQVPDPHAEAPATEPSDFDTRPGGVERHTILSWVQECRECGYCAEDIGSAAPEAAEIVREEKYQQCRNDSAVPDRARRFLCYARLLERLHAHPDAGWSALHAAWVCDDDGADGAAASCRRRALDLWQKGKAAGQQFGDDLATEFALATDLYRRIGEFEQATVACAEGLDIEDIPPVLEALLRRQLVLIQQRDTNPHSMRELLQS